ncbi:DUF429 domain-containing protein [Nesterenkonia marinintestina]|uniref:DUF429 domain-containing protein n=1 Tax=Nesterenkonia marinintestina TaxID=2979865 RepID=UPI0021BF261C|nr:DUF429 domain-containing protein [Nesterenkonia sp. GX14115]
MTPRAETGRTGDQSDVMIFAGIDLAAEARRTGVAVIREDRQPVLERVWVGADYEVLVATVESADKTGVDVPLGWPARFIDVVTAHAAGTLPPPDSTDSDWRRGVALRATDFEVHRLTGLTPLSVAADRIAYPALRWAGLEARLRERGSDVPRDGSGVIAEVYPAAALHRWSLTSRGYKGARNADVRSGLVADLVARTPWLDWNGHQHLCESDDDALDAVVAALIAREVVLGTCEPPPEHGSEQIRREGWIWLPRRPGPTPPSEI